MIHSLKNLFVRDWPLKVFSLALATLTWLAVSFTLKQGVAPVPGRPSVSERTYYELPVLIVSRSGNVAGYQATPKKLDVTVQGDEAVLKSLSGRNVKVIVDLSETTLKSTTKLPVEIVTPAGVTQVKIEPAGLVEVTPPPSPEPPANSD
jgi:YbbR domain-containing protein